MDLVMLDALQWLALLLDEWAAAFVGGGWKYAVAYLVGQGVTLLFIAGSKLVSGADVPPPVDGLQRRLIDNTKPERIEIRDCTHRGHAGGIYCGPLDR